MLLGCQMCEETLLQNSDEILNYIRHGQSALFGLFAKEVSYHLQFSRKQISKKINLQTF
jgi:hypothetical protein